MAFVRGEIRCPVNAYTFWKKTTTYDPTIKFSYIWEILDTDRKTREDYQRDKWSQFSLFDEEFLNSY